MADKNSKVAMTHRATGANFDFVSGDLFSSIPFTRVRHLGSGSQAEVFLMASKEKPELLTAAKVFYFGDDLTGQKSKVRYFQEIGILQQVNHFHIVQNMYSVVCESYGVMMMDYYPEGDLFHNMLSLEDRQVHQYFVQISCAVRYLHSKRIVHRDIKLENILLKDGFVFLTDFGIAQKVGDNSSTVTGRVGTVAFMAPEIRAARTALTEYDGFKADSFAVGVCLWSMMLKDEPDKETKYLDAVKIYNKHVGLDKTLLKSVRRLLKRDAKDRWDITRVLVDLRESGYHRVEIDMFS